MGRKPKLQSEMTNKHFKKKFLLNNIKLRKEIKQVKQKDSNLLGVNDIFIKEDTCKLFYIEKKKYTNQGSSNGNEINVLNLSHNGDLQCEKTIQDSSEQNTQTLPENHFKDLTINCGDKNNFLTICDKKTTNYITKGLCLIAVKKNLPRCAVNSILKLLNPVFPNMPKDYRKLLSTPRDTKIKRVFPGRYVHFGLKRGLIFKAAQLKLDVDTFKIDCFIDGVAIHPSSKNKTYWVVMAKIHGVEHSVIPIGLYNGRRKPDDFDEFLKKFVFELKDLIATGVEINGTKVNVEINNFCLDTPARSSVCGIIGHMGYRSCIRCLCSGVYKQRRMLFKFSNCERRTDKMFLDREDTRFHNRNSLVEKELNIKMLTQFPLDFLHVVVLGPGRKFFRKLVGIDKPMFPHSRATVDNLFSRINETSPAEIHRAFRNINDMASFKGHEWRLILLKLAPILLKNNIPRKYYEHYLLLTCAFSILCDPEKCIKYNRIAHSMLIKFNDGIKYLYSDLMYVPMVHQTVHFADEVLQQQKPCDRFSTWEFESFMTPIKNNIHGPKLPLSQIYRRITEYINCTDIIEAEIDKNTKGKNYLYFQGFRFDSKNCRDRFFLTKDKQIIVILRIVNYETPKFLCRKLKILEEFFELPLIASRINFFHVETTYIGSKFIIDVTNIERKLFSVITEENNLYMAPFHAFN